jgi:osmoprotectant transport system permease protein
VTWLVNNWQILPGYIGDHLRLALIPILLGFVLAVPLGWVAWRYRLTQGLLLTFVGLIYTIPSIALFVTLPSILGTPILSDLNVIVGLTLYAVAIMTRSVAEAIGSVDPDIRQSAVAVGYGAWHRFWTVDFPLAGPVMLAGLRVVAVSTVSLVTVGALVGVQSLGILFTDGFDRRIVGEILTGVVLTAVIALVIDLLLQVAGRVLMPWTRTGSTRRKAAA